MNTKALFIAVLLMTSTVICLGAARAPADQDSSIYIYEWIDTGGHQYGEYVPVDATEKKFAFIVPRKNRDDFPKECITPDRQKVKLWWKDTTGIGGLTNDMCRKTSREGDVELQSFTFLQTGRKIQLILPYRLMYPWEKADYKAGIDRHPDELPAHYLYRIRGHKPLIPPALRPAVRQVPNNHEPVSVPEIISTEQPEGVGLFTELFASFLVYSFFFWV